MYPLQVRLIRRAFRINDASYEKAKVAIGETLDHVETLLGDGRRSLLGGDELNYTDISFAAMSGPWLWPEGFAAGRADAVRPEPELVPQRMQQDVAEWLDAYPATVAWIRRLYAEERAPSAA